MNNFLEQIIVDDLESKKIDKIITRFPPEPNGYLHIGHAKSICLNFGLALKYGGICNLRFDDTNPAAEDDEYVNAIIRDVEWLGFRGDVLYGSDYFDIMYESAVKLIQKGLAFVCELTPEEMRDYRGTLTEPGKESPFRNRTVSENMRLFTDMKEGRIEGGKLTLRAKIDMSSPNINMRDPIIYRILNIPHHRAGKKWCIYPMYDFAHPIEDAVEKITHSICTLEFEDHRPFYDWVVENCGFIPKPRQYEFARLNITRTIMSKRYLKKLVEEKKVDGWDDPRMPTLSGMRRRGYPPESIRDFCDRIGVSKANSEVDAGLLEFCVRETLNKTAERRMVVLDPIELHITNFPGAKTLDIEFGTNPDGTEAIRSVGFSEKLYIERADFMINPPPKYFRLTPGGMVRLKGAYIFVHERHETDPDGNVTKVFGRIVENSRSGNDVSGLKVKGVIHWVDSATAINIVANKLDYLLLPDDGTKKEFSERLNPDSKIGFTSAKAEAELKNAKAGQAYQFLRQAYFCLDIKSGKDTPVFNEIVSLKDSYKP